MSDDLSGDMLAPSWPNLVQLLDCYICIISNSAVCVFYIVLYVLLTVEVDHCKSNPCNHGNCESDAEGFHCTCDRGWTGKLCDTGEII